MKCQTHEEDCASFGGVYGGFDRVIRMLSFTKTHFQKGHTSNCAKIGLYYSYNRLRNHNLCENR